MAKTTNAGFDCADIYREHAFLVRLSKGKAALAQVFEVFGRVPEAGEREWAPETILRCELPRATWDAVSGEVRSEFNRRLKTDGKWTSKLGDWEDIDHDSLAAVEGVFYGKAVSFMKRPIMKIQS